MGKAVTVILLEAELVHAQVSLLFYESRRKQANWLGIPQEERLYWEQWCINTAIVPSSVSLHEQSSPVTGGQSACCA